MSVKRAILLRYFATSPEQPLGMMLKVMVPSETKQPESLRDARDLWSVVTTTFYYFLSNAVSHTRALRRGEKGGKWKRGCRAMRETIRGRYREVIPLGWGSKLDNT